MSARIRLRSALRPLALGVAGALTLGGCGLGAGLYNAPLPGGADVGSHPLHLTVDLDDALDLVPQSGVKVNDVAVGRVTKVDLSKDGRTAQVSVLVQSTLNLPANAIASVQQTSLLGEKYIALAAPATGSEGRLADNATIPVSRTTQGVEVEQVLGALSLLLTEGGIGKISTITKEVNAFAHGNEGEIRSFFSQVDQIVTTFDENKKSITDALDALNTLAATLKQQDSLIKNVLTQLSPGLSVISQQRTQLVSTLDALHRLSDVTVSTLNQSKQNIVDDFKRISPIVGQLAAAGKSLPDSLQALLTFPFTDAATAGVKGDFLNTYIHTVYRTADASSAHTTSASTNAPPSGLLTASADQAALSSGGGS